MAEGVGLVAFGDLSSARTAFFIPSGILRCEGRTDDNLVPAQVGALRML